jgi:hypothetical protein
MGHLRLHIIRATHSRPGGGGVPGEYRERTRGTPAIAPNIHRARRRVKFNAITRQGAERDTRRARRDHG